MTARGIAMARLYMLAVLAIVAVFAAKQCQAPETPHAEPLVVTSGGAPTTVELAARIDMLELRMESRDDAIEALLWMAEQEREGRCP